MFPFSSSVSLISRPMKRCSHFAQKRISSSDHHCLYGSLAWKSFSFRPGVCGIDIVALLSIVGVCDCAVREDFLGNLRPFRNLRRMREDHAAFLAHTTLLS